MKNVNVSDGTAESLRAGTGSGFGACGNGPDACGQMNLNEGRRGV